MATARRVALLVRREMGFALYEVAWKGEEEMIIEIVNSLWIVAGVLV